MYTCTIDEDTPYPAYRQPCSQGSENAVFGMPLEVAVALTKLDADDLIPAVFRRCIEYLNDVGKVFFIVVVRFKIY